MSHPAGRRLPLSVPRRFIGDLLHFARQVPSVPVERRMNVAAVDVARRLADPRPGWCAVFTKAYAHVAARRLELRRAYHSFPWPGLYEHAENVASVAVERTVGDEEAVLFTLLHNPEQMGLAEIEARLRKAKEGPLDDNAAFRRILRVSPLPLPLRRVLWWWALNVSGSQRARSLGTFGVSAVSGFGACATHLLSPLTTTLDYGVIAPDGGVDVRLTIDHRVLDAGTAARALGDLEEVLHNEIVHELRYLERLAA